MFEILLFGHTQYNSKYNFIQLYKNEYNNFVILLFCYTQLHNSKYNIFEILIFIFTQSYKKYNIFEFFLYLQMYHTQLHWVSTIFLNIRIFCNTIIQELVQYVWNIVFYPT